jgi:hypothetical protein
LSKNSVIFATSKSQKFKYKGYKVSKDTINTAIVRPKALLKLKDSIRIVAVEKTARAFNRTANRVYKTLRGMTGKKKEEQVTLYYEKFLRLYKTLQRNGGAVLSR